MNYDWLVKVVDESLPIPQYRDYSWNMWTKEEHEQWMVFINGVKNV